MTQQTVGLEDCPDRVPGECAWRDHLPAADPEGLAALNRSGKNRVDNFLVLAFREIDKGRKSGLAWPDGWKNGAGREVRRWAGTVDAVRQHAIEIAQGLRSTLPALRRIIASLKKAETALARGRPGAALSHLRATQGNPWTPWELQTTLQTPNRDHLRVIIERTQKLYDETKRGPVKRFAERFILVRKIPRRLIREQRVLALVYLVKAYHLDTGRMPTLVSKDWQHDPAEGSFDAYLSTFCSLAIVPEGAMRELFRHHKPQA
jgi:hypothetical protein